MKIGFIGAGNVTGTFGGHLLHAGHTVVVSNSRGPETLAAFVAALGPGANAGTRQQAADCDIVILATHWLKVPDALKGIDWRGRILVDATNAHIDPQPDIRLEGVTRSRAALKSNGRGSSEKIAEMAAGARLVKALSNMPMAWIQDFSTQKPPTVIFTSGDDPEAKKLVIDLINGTGLVAIDLGSLAMGDAMYDVGGPVGVRVPLCPPASVRPIPVADIRAFSDRCAGESATGRRGGISGCPSGPSDLLLPNGPVHVIKH